jgi:hypothetical protein
MKMRALQVAHFQRDSRGYVIAGIIGASTHIREFMVKARATGIASSRRWYQAWLF